MVTINARVPFKGQVDDDHGLNEVRYAYTISRAESGRINRRAAWPVLGGTTFAPGGQNLLPGLMDLAITVQEAHDEAAKKSKEEAATIENYALPSFKKALEDRTEDAFVHPDTVSEELKKPQREPYRQLLRNFAVKPDVWTQPDLDPLGCDLPLWKTNPNLKMTDPSRPQPRYQMQIWLEAVDTDLDSEKAKDGKPQPHVKVSEEKFTFFLVSENELLTEIAKEEEKLHNDLNVKYEELLETQVKLVRVGQDLTSASVKAEELGAMSARTDQVNEVLEKSQNLTREIYTAYARILKEMKANRIDSRFVERVEKTLVDPLKSVDGVFESTRDSVNAFRTALDSKDLALPERVAASQKAGNAAKEQMRVLMTELQKILDAMRKMSGINELVKILREIEQRETDQYETIMKIYKEKEDDVFRQATQGDKPEEKKK
jgi:hypothetical protein